ncbi:branched-chain amino acid ABC transporter permease [Dactylosporangium sucinum]|uniref:Branched-chain amino acid ABC transporter permease n=1 Tax=Dactylosporangium sucinum TaxID=1424081 RepID=A0A917TT35_9ACTN|nr:branched-chain amino acid ABC transporter permease [Dactylosporangium sucinum]
MVLPSLIGAFHLILATQIVAFALVAVSLQLLWGRAGQLSFGQAAFFGIGAYAYGYVSSRDSAGGWLAICVAVLIPSAIALLMGYFLFFGGVRGAYFSIVTLAFVLITYQVAISWQSVTGGDSGLTGINGLILQFGAFKLDFSTGQGPYYGALIFLLLGLIIATLVRFSSFGLVLEAIREDENRAKFLGYNTSLYLTGVLTLSAALAGLAGGAYASVSLIAAPDMVGSLLSIEILTWVAIGGRNHIAGALIGTAFMRILNDQASTLLQSSWPLVVGLVFVAVVLFFPAGIIGAFTNLRRRLTTYATKREAR